MTRMKHEWPTLVALDPTMTVTWWHDSLGEEHGHAVASAYTERFWLPVIGPSALWLARRLVERIDQDVDMAGLAAAVGLHAGLAANGPMTKAIYRLIHFGFARRAGDVLDVRTHVDRVPHRLLARCPELQREAAGAA